jgi:hypothetical protein
MNRSAAYSRWSVSLLVATVALSLLATGPSLHGASKLDRPRAMKFRVTDYLVADDCALFELFDQVARAANVALGFENLPGCGFGKRTIVPAEFGRVLDASTPREAFDEIAALNRNFQWREVDGMAIVRPTQAWDDPEDLLNLPAHAFQLMNVAADDALYRVLDAATPRVRYVQARGRARGSLEAPVSVDFSGGTLLRALNAVVRAKGDAEWRVGYVSSEAAILIGRLSKLSEPAVGYVSRIIWTA